MIRLLFYVVALTNIAMATSVLALGMVADDYGQAFLCTAFAALNAWSGWVNIDAARQFSHPAPGGAAT